MASLNSILSHLVLVAGAANIRPPSPTGSNPKERHFTARFGIAFDGVVGKWLVVRRYGPSHLACMYRFFRHGGKVRPLIFIDRLASSHITRTIFFRSSGFPTKTLGNELLSVA
uniref:Secreted protein n=1 Tax=Opuntia streptacantha TaxID=393608 RepID=A0A7C8ZHP2_OPUST